MRICKHKRGLALFMALVMSLSLLPVTAMAEDDDHVHNADGWECTRVDPVTEPDCQHKEHTPDCGYAAAMAEIPCDCGAAADEATGEVIHADGCAYTPAVEEQPCTHKCGDECTKVVAPEHWNCTAPVAAETPAGVQAFLDAAALLPDASLVTEETVETVDAQAASALALYAALGVELQAREDVIAAKAAVDAVQAAVQTVRESQVPEVPAEVQTFLDKVKDLPEAALVTAENVEIVDAQVTDALALYGSLGELQVREDVAAALVTVEAVRAAVRAVKESEVPAEVQAFLDAVEALPKAEEVTRENVTAIGEQVKVVLDMYESLTEAGLDEADGVAEALAIAYDIFAVVTEVSETLGNNESTTWDGVSVSTGLDKGAGTEVDPYLIENAADLAYLAKLTWEKAGGNNKTKDQYYKLTADIDLGNHEWTPIGGIKGITGNTNYYFQGHFIGGGHTISNLRIAKPDDVTKVQTAGLFGSIYNAEICDLKLSNVSITRPDGKFASGSTNAYSGAGALVGLSYSGQRSLICNITVSNAGISWDQYAGGIVGNDQSFTDIKKCRVRDSSDISATMWGAGGIIGGLSKGQVIGTTYVTECSSKDCDISSKYGAVGGIVGYCGRRTGSQDVTGSVIIKGCYNASNVSYRQVQFPDKQGVANYPAGAGGIIGYSYKVASPGKPGSNGVAIHNCTNYGTITAPAGSSMYGKGYAGGIVGYGMEFSIHFIGTVNNLDLNIHFPDPDCNIPIKGCHNAGVVTTSNKNSSNKSYVVLANLIGYPYSSIIPAADARLPLRKAFYLKQGNSFVSGLIDGSYATVKTTRDIEYATPVDTAEQFTPIDPCPGPAGGCTCGCHCTWHEGDGPDGPDVEPPKVDYTLVYDANGGVFEYNAKTKTDTESGLKDAMYVTFDVRDYTPIWENHTFLGWATTSNATEAQYKYNESGKDTVTFSSTDYMVLYAVWRCALSITKTASNTAPKVGEEFTYTLKVSNPNSEAVSANITDTLDEKLTYVSSSDSGVHTDGTGTDGKNGGTVTWTNIEVSASSTKSVTLTVKANTDATIENTAKVTWPGDDTGKTSDPCTITATAKKYNVTFDVNGGKETIPDQQVEDGGKAIKPADPTKDGYTFVKWTLNGAEYDFDTPVTDNITLVAQYTPDEAKIVFVTNAAALLRTRPV